jgi:FdhD protein
MSLNKVQKTIIVRPSQAAALLDTVVRGQEIFRATGGTHAAGLFNEDQDLLALSEDVGRHNALDKTIGKLLLSRKRKEARIGILTSRLSYEMVQKAARLGLEILAGASSATSLAIELARSVDMTLIGFLRKGRGNIYTCPERVTYDR